MALTTIPKKINTIDSFQIRGEKFVVLKKEYLDELFLLLRSFLRGEQLLRGGATRSFGEFLRSAAKKRK